MPTIRQQLVSLFTRRYPFISGCGTFANSALVQLAAGAGSNEVAWARLKKGPWVLVPLRDYVGKAIFYVGDLDRKISNVIDSIVRPSDTVIDVGANLGIITLQLAKAVGPGGHVHSFEPNPEVASLLKQSVQKNCFTNIHIHTCALGSCEGTTDLAIPSHNAGQATLNAGRAGDDWQKVQVPVRTLASVAKEQGVSKVRLMKIDVEGYELEVLRGAEEWLASCPPELILFENNEKGQNSVLSLLVIVHESM